MIKSYFLVAWRNLLRNRIFSFINVGGLAIGLCTSFLIYQYVRVERSYDRFHNNADRIYRIPISYSGSFSDQRPSATNHPSVGPALKSDFPEIEEFTRLFRSTLYFPTGTLLYEGNGVSPIAFNEQNVYFADSTFLSVFSFPLIKGNIKTVLKQPRSIVMTKRMARKYFGDAEAIGKTLKLNWMNFTVTGILKDIPQNSHLQFDFLLSAVTFNQPPNWRWPEFYNYILLKPGTDPRKLEAKFPAFMGKYLGKVWEEYKFKSEITLQPIADIHLKSDLSMEQSVNGSEELIYFLSLLGVFVLIVAWINYVNLSTAKSLERSKEVGIRKVSGATKRQLIVQFFMDAALVNVLAIILAALLLIITLPFFETVTGKNITETLFFPGAFYRFSFWGWVIGTLLLGVFVVGVYPALLLSSFNPANVLKGKFHKSDSGILLRKSLVVFQYVLSIFLIAGTITISRQLTFMKNKDLGYNKEQVLVVRAAPDNDSTYSRQVNHFKNRLTQLPAVERISRSTEIPGQRLPQHNEVWRINQEEKESVVTYFVDMDDEYIPTFSMSLVAGRNFSTLDRFVQIKDNKWQIDENGFLINGGQNRILINEDLAQKLGFSKTEDAVGQLVKFRQGALFVGEIIGVIRNYNQASLKEKYDPILYTFPAYEGWRYFSIRVNTSNLPQTIVEIGKTFIEAFPNAAFEYFFLDKHFDQQYQQEIRFANVFRILTILAIIISCLGLFGLGIFSLLRRTKEIGIRKILGASGRSILLLFSMESIRLVLFAYLIASPMVYFAVQNWLGNFAFHIGMEWGIFVIPLVFLASISVTIIVFISIRAALTSPVVSLRSE